MNSEKLTPNLHSRFLHLGCGLHAPEEWLNVDSSIQVLFAQHPRLKALLLKAGLYPKSQAAIPWPANVLRLDLRKVLPWSEGRFDAVYTSHTLEHLYRQDAVNLLKECFRVLKSGGICRMVVPDLGFLVKTYWETGQVHGAARPIDGRGLPSAADKLMSDLNVYPPASERGWLGLYHRLMGFHQHKWMYDALSLEMLLIEAGFKNITHPEYGQGRMPGILQIENPTRVLNGAGIIEEAVKP